jgi:uncharacterized protein YecA (UPF0149 family)
MSVVVSSDAVERTISAFTRLDQRGDRKAMNKLAMRLQKEQPFLLQYAAAVRGEHGDATGEAAVFYATLMWAMFDRARNGETLPRITAENLAEADKVVTASIASVTGFAELAPQDRIVPSVAVSQPHICAKIKELLTEDVKEEAMTNDTCTAIVQPTQVVIEAFDAALAGRRPGERQGTIVAAASIGRNDPCSCGSGKKFKKCHGAV